MADPVFSIVTISYNQAEFLPRTIESVVTQAGPSIEYIVCDPGSTDGSRAIIDSYGERIARRLYAKDRGPADGLNQGFAVATGRIFGYLNSDDTLLPGALAKVAAYFDARPEVDVVTGHGLVIDRQDRVLRKVWSEPFGRRMVAYGASVQVQPSTFIRAEAFRRSGGFNIANRSTWDGELLVALYQSGATIRVMDAMLSCYRLHATSITNSGSEVSGAAIAHDARFRRLMGRGMRASDFPLGRALRLYKHLRQPLATVERLRNGRIFMRGAD